MQYDEEERKVIIAKKLGKIEDHLWEKDNLV